MIPILQLRKLRSREKQPPVTWWGGGGSSPGPTSCPALRSPLHRACLSFILCEVEGMLAAASESR